jgi:hypothetical protein
LRLLLFLCRVWLRQERRAVLLPDGFSTASSACHFRQLRFHAVCHVDICRFMVCLFQPFLASSERADRAFCGDSRGYDGRLVPGALPPLLLTRLHAAHVHRTHAPPRTFTPAGTPTLYACFATTFTAFQFFAFGLDDISSRCGRLIGDSVLSLVVDGGSSLQSVSSLLSLHCVRPVLTGEKSLLPRLSRAGPYLCSSFISWSVSMGANTCNELWIYLPNALP